MPDTNTNQNNNPADANPPTGKPLVVDRMPEVVAKIGAAQNILIALSSDPSVDEMAAAIGLTLFLDRAGKRATAIYSGTTPNALSFLEPEKTFDNSADCLQDFIVALNKEKADHIRYKLDGDFVKVYITPYKARIEEEDLGFSYGDYNVDLVIALDVANGIDLDDALHEHGRIMHDASIVNITTGRPGKFGEVEWSDAEASSVSEMVAKLLFVLANKEPLEPNEATAIMTGIVAATYRFSNARTMPSTLAISSKLMEYGADQQLIAKNITPDIDNEMMNPIGVDTMAAPVDATMLAVGHEEEGTKDSEHEVESGNLANNDEKPIIDEALMNELKMVSANIAEEVAQNPVASTPAEAMPEYVGPQIPTPGAASAPVQPVVEEAPAPAPEPEPMPVTDYGQMMNDALNESENPAMAAAPAVAEVETNNVPEMDFASAPATGGSMISAPDLAGQSAMSTEQVPTMGESYIMQTQEKVLSPVSDLPMPEEGILPPPPVPPVDFSSVEVPSSNPFENVNAASNMQAPAGGSVPIDGQFGGVLPTVDPNMMQNNTAAPLVDNGQVAGGELGTQPAMVDQVYNPVANNPSAFKIPGM